MKVLLVEPDAYARTALVVCLQELGLAVAPFADPQIAPQVRAVRL
jgi:hypothetical protein